MRRLLVPLLIAFYAAAAPAQLYSWKDASGKVHYSDEPPPDKTPARKVAPPSAPSADSAAVRRGLAEQEAAARKKQKESQEAATKAEQDRAAAEDRRANCDKAKGNLQAIESGQIRFTTNAQGERVALDGAVRDAEIANARKSVDSLCR